MFVMDSDDCDTEMDKVNQRGVGNSAFDYTTNYS